MGGTFDPIHNGHLSAASEVADRLGLDEVVFVPTGQPWQKADVTISPAEDRYAMTVLATAAHPAFRVSRVDIERPGATYTIDTLRDLRQEYGDSARLFFIVGADTLANLSTWKAADEVVSLATFVAVGRPGFELDDTRLPPGTEVTVVDTPALDISSTDCRRRVARGGPVWFLVPDAVAGYIASRRLYRRDESPKKPKYVVSPP